MFRDEAKRGKKKVCSSGRGRCTCVTRGSRHTLRPRLGLVLSWRGCAHHRTRDSLNLSESYRSLILPLIPFLRPASNGPSFYRARIAASHMCIRVKSPVSAPPRLLLLLLSSLFFSSCTPAAGAIAGGQPSSERSCNESIRSIVAAFPTFSRCTPRSVDPRWFVRREMRQPAKSPIFCSC